ncbi:hypothetical protein GC209_12180 [bacterium]|nr:hypothetical protein [bacterium]
MALVTLTDLYSTLDFWPGNLLAAADGVTIGTHSGTAFSYTYLPGTTFAGYSVTAQGSGFAYDGTTPTAGTMTALAITDGNGQTVLSVTGIAAGSLASDLGLFASYEFGFTDGNGNFSGSEVKNAWSQLLSGNDTIIGTAGGDWNGLVGVNAGNDRFDMGAGDDFIRGGMGSDTMNGGDGYDTLSYDQTQWNEGIPMLHGISVNVNKGLILDPYGFYDHFSGIEEIHGSAAHDVFVGGATEVDFAGLRGSDKIVGGTAGDIAIYSQDVWTGGNRGILANLGVNVVNGQDIGTIRDGFGNYDHTVNIHGVYGTRFADTFLGSARNDYFSGGEGKDTYYGRGGNDTVDFHQSFAGQGQHGVRVNLALKSGQIVDDGFGNTEAAFSIENIDGTRYNDLIIGNAAANRLQGKEGNDILRGGLGHDTFVWNHFREIGEHDVVKDFHVAADAQQDYLQFHVTEWGGTTTLHLVNGTAATAAEDTFLFDSATHMLSWDPDGTGAQAAIDIAVLDGVTALTAANFELF